MHHAPRLKYIISRLFLTLLVVSTFTSFDNHHSIQAASPDLSSDLQDQDNSQPEDTLQADEAGQMDQTSETQESTTSEETSTTIEETTTTLEIIAPTPPINFEPDEPLQTSQEDKKTTSSEAAPTENLEETHTSQEKLQEPHVTTSSQKAGSLVVISKQTVSVDYLLSSYLKLAQINSKKIKQIYYLTSLMIRQLPPLANSDELRVLDLLVIDWWIQCIDYLIDTNNIT